MPHDVLAALIRDHATERGSSVALLAALRTPVHRVAEAYPHAYFESGHRDAHSLSRLEAQVLEACQQTAIERAPFGGRTPFQTYLDEGSSDPVIRLHTCFSATSVTRAVLRDSYAARIAQEPGLQRVAHVYRVLGPVLSERAERVEGPPVPGLWRVPPRGPVRVLAPAQVRERLAGTTRPLEALALQALALAGQPLTRSALSHLVAGMRGGGAPLPEPQGPAVARGLAEGEFADRLWVSADDAVLAEVPAGLPGPASVPEAGRPWASSAYSLHLEPHRDGGHRVLLLGPRAAILAGRALVPGVWVHFPEGVPTPPVLTLQDGEQVVMGR